MWQLCLKLYSARTNSILSNFNCFLIDCFIIIYIFFNFKHDINNYLRETSIKSKKTVIKFTKILRQICFEYFILNSGKIGGPDKIVQIDETLVFRKKYNVGHIPRQIWIIGGICPETG